TARLTRGAFGAQVDDARAQLVAIAVSELEIDPRDHEARRQAGAPVGEIHFVFGEVARGACGRDAMHEGHDAGHFTAERTRIHDEAAADGTRNTFAKLETRQ